MRFKTWHALIAIGLLVLLTVAVLAQVKMRTADIQPCRPPSTRFEAWNRFRSLPVKFTEIDGDTVYWKFEDPTGIQLGSFHLERHSLFLDEKLEKKNRLFFEFNLTKTEWDINYDAECFSLLSATQLK